MLTFDGAGKVLTRHLHGPGLDNILAVEDAATGYVQWALTDHLRSVRGWAEYDAVAGTTSVTATATFDSYGILLSTTGSTPDVGFAYGYTGQEWDADVGLSYYYARWYDPTVGRFVSEDPIGFGGGSDNVNAYVGNHPIGFSDPSGLQRTVRRGPGLRGRIRPIGRGGTRNQGGVPSWYNPPQRGWGPYHPGYRLGDPLVPPRPRIPPFNASGDPDDWPGDTDRDPAQEWMYLYNNIYCPDPDADGGMGGDPPGPPAPPGADDTDPDDEPVIIQSGGNKFNKRTADILNGRFGTNHTRRDWGRALENLKQGNGLRPDHHGRIDSHGNYRDANNNIIDNISYYLG